ncbi:PQQ-binding-like beta-propeller repeat protein [Olivibacter sp. SDN3]|uniref:outer membrane protein assembly factor BamB family protein n=1 Tax=Olivibacter sp. SDN3 TaxID=2764720 RepID=UPI0016510EF9|nr:PQQ-binding-like beta-propeller repeat protein [Olivibacter sp. SDN3]QNL51977.1 PQQ-binding-like beta-propeller repeat protein [Olivibacter sp. SDN3]
MKTKIIRYLFYGLALLPIFSIGLQQCTPEERHGGAWPSYLGGDDRNHYSPLQQIDTANVNLLREAWVYHTGDSGEMQCNPLIIDGKLYALTASNQLFALDAATGEELWRFREVSEGQSHVNRGMAYWAKGNDKRLLFTSQSYLYAIDAETGKSITSFGESGRISLRTGLSESAADKFVVSTTPGTIYQDLIMMPIRVGEGVSAAPGYIQAFNVVTGKLAWVFRTIPHPGELGYETWPEQAYKDPAIGGANNWAGMAVDQKRGIVFIPTGSAAFDFYGGNRKGENLFANSLLALNAKTGEYIWHFQAVHHDVWDRDFPAPPNLTTVQRKGRTVDVVAQITKSGHTFVFDRETGEAIFPIDEVPVPVTGVPGEELWPTQPIPQLPVPFSRQSLSEADITTFSNKRDSLIDIFRQANKGLFQPLGLTPTLLFPGADGGAEWGGAAVDKQGILYVNSNEMAWLFSLSATNNKDQSNKVISSGRNLYSSHCVACHKPDLSGSPESGYPALTDLKERMSRDSISDVIALGRGMMPGLTHISERERQSIVNYLFGEEKEEVMTEQVGLVADEPYTFNGYNKFLDEQQYPAITPPWGTLTAINLNTGKHIWQVPLGEFKELTAKGIPLTGTENYGGPVVTAGGLLFIAATKDKMIRAFSKDTGKLLWEHELPASGFATPATYQVNGKQYVVIACGGTKLGTSKGDSYVAFALP